MTDWFRERVVEAHRLPLFWFFVALITAFVFTRVNVRLIRARVRWLGNISVGEMHIHHVVFGVVLTLLGGVAGLVLSGVSTGWYSFSSAVFGAGAALVLDEFALILHLRDVYWQEKGRASVDAVFVAIAATGLLLLGLRPLAWNGTDGADGGGGWTAAAFLVVNLVFAVATLLKGKIWSGLLGLFVPPLLYVGAVRVARPGSPWARWFYSERARRPRPRLMAKAVHREERWRRPVIRAKIAVQEFVSGRHDLPAPEPPVRHHRRRVVSPRPRPGADHSGRHWRSGRPRAR